MSEERGAGRFGRGVERGDSFQLIRCLTRTLSFFCYALKRTTFAGSVLTRAGERLVQTAYKLTPALDRPLGEGDLGDADDQGLDTRGRFRPLPYVTGLSKAPWFLGALRETLLVAAGQVGQQGMGGAWQAGVGD